MSITRRSFLVATAAAMAATALRADPAAALTPRPDGLNITPSQALSHLKKGNAR